MRSPYRRSLTALVALLVLGSLAASTSCSSDDGDGAKPTTDGGGGDDGGYPVPGPGEQCFDPDPSLVKLRTDPPELVLAPGQTRDVEVFASPDFCVPAAMTFTSGQPDLVAAPAPARIDLATPKVTVSITAGSGDGKTTLTASVPLSDGSSASVDLPIEVRSAKVDDCAGTGAGHVGDGATVSGTGGLALASISLQKGATKPNAGSFLWHADAFDATIACAKDQVPAGYVKLGPAVTFGPAALSFNREIPFTLPINPAAIPAQGRLRHVTVSYRGPAFEKPRVIPIADPAIMRDGDGYKLYFMAPRLGTYQAVALADAGTKTFQRHLTHRALIGVSMGGGGTAMFGLRNHDKFDVIAPLGGPVDWTWMAGHIERNQVAGFPPNDGDNVPSESPYTPDQIPAPLPYQHPSTFNHWWYEYPKNGNGGSFPRAEYIQIFRDLSLMFGNMNGYNPAPDAENLPAGVSPDDPSVVGDHPGRQCSVWVDPLDGPDKAAQQELERQCPIERCSHPLTLQNYYDDEFNPKGTWPVITVCDGSPQQPDLSPWANTWQDTGNGVPLELALAVDYNGNGVRDENEPIIRAGHEPYDDVGLDGKADADEPGYQKGIKDDPSGDNWDPQYNPLGTEGNLRYDDGEPYRDFGLDGVANTKTSPYDFGEGNGKFDRSIGLRTIAERDSRSVIEQLPEASQQKPFDDAAMRRLDMWTDGGTRDLFNFAVDAQALAGAWSGRGPIVHYYTQFDRIPGQIWGNQKSFVPGVNAWGDIPSGVLLRYGPIDPTPQDIQSGTGQHVGTADDIARRLQSALYYIGSRWPDAPHTLDEDSQLNPSPDADPCEVTGGCDFTFTDTLGRTGPVSVNVPPGYANANSQHKRYPVIYLLHGYGQTPEDLKAAIVFLKNWMNAAADSSAERLPKAILVYVDGRCRVGQKGAECIRGTFYTDSVRESGPKIEHWFLELMDEIDKRYRTMAPAELSWTE